VPFHRGDSDDALADAVFARGVGMHFRDAPRATRALEAFRERRIRVLVATSGLATGVNTPARAVIIRDLELGMSPLQVSEAQQMFGRAGRAGQEPEGFGFLLVPADEEADWRVGLAAGYTARSRVLEHLDDTLLAEILIGSVPDRPAASAWFEQTFAHAQGGTAATVDNALDELVLRGFVIESADGLAVTEIGALTSRLMIDVASAGALLAALSEAPVPASADEAEELVLHLVTTHAVAFQEWPVTMTTHGDQVDDLLRGWSDRVTARPGPSFGSRFCMAAGQLALREPRRLLGRSASGASMGEFRRAAEELPRTLAWLAALGLAGVGTWEPAVAGDLARRLTWWNLTPHPGRGSGRLLWMLERLLDPENRRARMQQLWGRAHQAGYAGPDRINARPREVDVSAEDFRELLRGRASLRLFPPEGLVLPVGAPAEARLTVVANTGARRAWATTRPVGERVSLPLPRSRDAREIAADLFLYTRQGDFAYQNLTADLPADLGDAAPDPLAEARALLGALPDLAVTDAAPSGLRRLLQTRRQRRLADLAPLLTPDPLLRPVALALAEHSLDPAQAVLAVRANLGLLLARGGSPQDAPRPARLVLRSGTATAAELELTLAALAGALGVEAGVAAAGRQIAALVRVAGTWLLAAPPTGRVPRLAPILPDTLPLQVSSLRPAPEGVDLPAAPRCGWLVEFAPDVVVS
jgi:hypothetical protein